MKVIILTSEQAEKVRGRHGKYSALDPVLADNGMFILPTDVMDDPEHKEVFADLGECKFAEIDILQVTDTKLPEDDLMREKQVLSVKEISPVIITTEKAMAEKPIYDKVIKK